MTESTKEKPAPLDGFERAKPDEPIFTLQGGDPLASAMVEMWAVMARARAGAISPSAALVGSYTKLAARAEDSRVEETRQIDALLIRATKAEEVAWAMDSYRKGHERELAEEEKEAPQEQRLVDLHDYRVRSVSKINNAVAELAEMQEELNAKGYQDPLVHAWINSSVEMLKNISAAVEPRRMMKNA